MGETAAAALLSSAGTFLPLLAALQHAPTRQNRASIRSGDMYTVQVYKAASG